MLSSLILLFSLILVFVPVIGQCAPRITFDKEVHDYGRVLYGDTVSDEFIVTNSGDQVLIIDKLEASCGCTKAIKGSSEVPPKGQTKIMAAFDTTGLRGGKKQKTIYVHSNDPERPVVKLTLLADVVRELSLDPPTLAKTLDSYTESVSFPINIANSSDKPVTIKSLKSQLGTAPAIMTPKGFVIKPHSSASFTIKINLRNEPGRQYWMGRFNLETDHPKENEIEIRYLIKVNKVS